MDGLVLELANKNITLEVFLVTVFPKMDKPPLLAHFFHTGPALSDSDFLTSVFTTAPAPAAGQTSASTSAPLSALPTPVACSPFKNTENDLIDRAWHVLNADRQKLAQQESPLPSQPGSLSDVPPDSLVQRPSSDSEFDRKGKRKLAPDPLQTQDPLIQDPEDEDGVLNLGLENQPHIVPVGVDSMFTVDVKRLKLYPAFWHGPHLDVYRGEWFYPSTSQQKFYPCGPELSHAIEAAYDQIKPWDLSYEDELHSALKIGTDAEGKLKVHLEQFNHDVIFQSASQGRLYSTAVGSRISKTLLTNFFSSISMKTSGHSGGTVVVRGWDEAQSWSGVLSEDLDRAKSKEQSTNAAHDADGISVDRPTGLNTTADMLQEEALEDPSTEVSELILVIHGIGQKLAQSYDSFDFVHACNQLRAECHKASTADPKMKDFLQNKRTQFIPIRWRHALNFEMDGCEGADSGMEEKVSKNTFTLNDIKIPDSIPFVREIVTGLVLDVPLYMSPKQHKRMVAAVIEQANKVYQLFCHRNAYYTGRKVSILAHSLGAALTVDILSRQPNVWTMDVETSEVIANTLESLSRLDHFCFDTSKVFLVGSPVAFFFHLHREQLIAREGLSKSAALDQKHSPEWRAAHRVTFGEAGQYGCLAAETIYNVYISTDPVAYCMNACVDSEHSKSIRPIDAQSFTKQFLGLTRKKRQVSGSRHMSLRSFPSLVAVSSWLGSSNKADQEASQQVPNDEMAVSDLDTFPTLGKPGSRGGSPAPTRQASLRNGLASMIKRRATSRESVKDETPKRTKQQHSLGSMRFHALNPSGSVDFVIPSFGLNQYVDMVTAHAAYWNDARFARLILVGLFGADEMLKEVGERELEETRVE